VKRLHNQRPLSDQAFEAMNDKDHKTIDDMRNAAMEAAATITALRQALKPFADMAVEIEKCAAQYDEKDAAHDPENWMKGCNWDDLLAAHEAYEDSK
jgi:hypothetical protein